MVADRKGRSGAYCPPYLSATLSGVARGGMAELLRTSFLATGRNSGAYGRAPQAIENVSVPPQLTSEQAGAYAKPKI